jgi:hypothetical protein
MLAGLPLLTGTASAQSQVTPNERAMYFRSSDGGDDFDVHQLDDQHRGTMIVQAAAYDGTVHTLWNDTTDFPNDPAFPGPAGVWYRRSTNSGRDFDSSILLTDPTLNSTEGDLALNGETVHVVLEEQLEVEGFEEVFYTRSDDDGESFGEAINVSNTPGIAETDPDIAVDGDNVAVFWEGNDDDNALDVTRNRDVMGRVSHDGGETWIPALDQPPMNLTKTIAAGNVQDDEPSVAVEGATVVIAFRRGGGQGPAWWMRSTDGGVTFASPAPTQLPTLPGNDSSDNGPAIHMEDGIVHIMAADKDDNAANPLPADDNNQVLYWRSTDGGATFGPPTNIFATPSAKVSLDGVGADLHVATESETPDGGNEIFYSRSNNGGLAWDEFRNISTNFGGSTDPGVAVDPEDPDDVHLVFKDETEFLFSLKYGQDLPDADGDDVSYANEDVIRFSGGAYEKIVDGGDVGLRNFRIDALAVIHPPAVPGTFPADDTARQFVLSFTESGSVPGIGTVDDSDLVLFTPTRLGADTRGTFSMYFDGSDVGLTSSSEDVDSVDVVGGDIYLSTSGSFSTGTTTGANEDIFVCQAAVTGANTTCASTSVAFDGSAAGLAASSEDIDAFTFTAGDDDGLNLQEPPVLFSTTGDFATPTASGEESDLFSCDFAAALSECGTTTPLHTTFVADTYDIDENITAIAMENRKIEEPDLPEV